MRSDLRGDALRAAAIKCRAIQLPRKPRNWRDSQHANILDVRAPYPSRAATALFLVSVAVFVAGVVVLIVGPRATGQIIAIVGVLGCVASGLVNHRRSGN